MNADVWSGSLMIVYNDEHGGFYDHVAPPSFDNAAAGNVLPPPPAPPLPPDLYAFKTLGPRVPGMLISPWVTPGKTNHDLYDHTSVLQLLAEVFTPGKPFSEEVANRAKQGIRSISTALTDAALTVPPPPPPAAPIFSRSLLGDNIASPPDNDMGRSMENAALTMIKKNPNEVDAQFPLLNNWKAAVIQARPATVPQELK